MAGQAEGREESCEGVEEGCAWALLTDNHTCADTRQVHTTILQDVCVAAKLLATGVQHCVRDVGVSDWEGREDGREGGRRKRINKESLYDNSVYLLALPSTYRNLLYTNPLNTVRGFQCNQHSIVLTLVSAEDM